LLAGGLSLIFRAGLFPKRYRLPKVIAPHFPSAPIGQVLFTADGVEVSLLLTRIAKSNRGGECKRLMEPVFSYSRRPPKTNSCHLVLRRFAAIIVNGIASLADGADCIDIFTPSSAKTQRPSQRSRSVKRC